MTAETDCHSVFPYFPLVKEGKIIGLGWQIIGKSPEDKYERKWFEHGSSSRAVEVSNFFTIIILKLIVWFIYLKFKINNYRSVFPLPHHAYKIGLKIMVLFHCICISLMNPGKSNAKILTVFNPCLL